MCGLYCSIGYPPDQNRIDIVAHRGPDGRGWQEFSSPSGPVAMGHRRLAIIDTSGAGQQPMSDPTGRFHLIYNGELYNYIELRKELETCGEVFRTETDSEVLLRAYVVWGHLALAKFRGMFSFVIWDNFKKRLFAARDRFGVKPLYIVANQHGVAFASEIKQLLGLPALSGRMNVARVYDFLASGISDHTGQTMFEGINQLRGGECCVVDTDHTGAIQVQSWRWYAIMNHENHLTLSEDSAAIRFRELLTDSVRIHLRSDVPLGACLSGGLDSSSIACLMAEMRDQRNVETNVNAFSACFSEKSVDEKPFMEAVIAHTHATPNYIYPRAEDLFARAAEITWHQDEPFGSSSIFAQWCVFEEAKRVGIKVMLDGQGADEQLAGYHSSFPYYLAHLMRCGRFLMLARTLSERSRLHRAPILGQIQQLAVSLLPFELAAFLRRQRSALLGNEWLASPVELMGKTPNPSGTATDLLDLPPASDVGTYCYSLTFANNLQTMLHWEDRNSMAHSVEARVPFLDHPLVEFSLMLGNNHKIVGSDTKRVLRQAMSGILPDVIRDRRDKIGFAPPEQSWFGGPLKELISEGIAATLTRYPALFNSKGTKHVAAAMLNGTRPVDAALWRIVNLGIWGKRFNVTM